MTKTLRSCKKCSKPLPDHVARFSVAADTTGGPVGVFCGVRCYLAMTHTPEELETAYAKAFIPVERGHADADCLQPEEKIAP